MAIGLVGVVTLIYTGATLAFAWERQWWWALVYLGYTVANVGLMAAQIGSEK